MKAYLFDRLSGLYEGEDFFDPGEINEDEGVTSIAPPTARSGHVPVYDPNKRDWKLVTTEQIRYVVNPNG